MPAQNDTDSQFKALQALFKVPSSAIPAKLGAGKDTQEPSVWTATTDTDHTDRFITLIQTVQTALKTQNSELAILAIGKQALELGSSDIHFEKHETGARLRLRIDGNLETIMEFAEKEYALLVERTKYKAELKLNITHLPQDGRFGIEGENIRMDVRVSTLPVKNGENLVLRVLDSSRAIPSLDKLGFMWTAKRDIEKSLEKKGGMVLVTGPTGSGKTTTLYSLLSRLNVPNRKVITLEDPIEYRLSGIVQSEVSEKSGYTYDLGLKALLRQDPDVVMIGEIRDLETARIASQAALTGHLVLSTLHTKSSVETLERLLNIGLPPYVVASAVDVIIAQRLVRKVCDHCREEYPATEEQNHVISTLLGNIGIGAVARAKQDGFTLSRGRGCDACAGTGFKGRIGVYEVLVFTDELRDLIRAEASPRAVLEVARKKDLILMREDGILKAMRGKTTMEELFSVVEVG